MKLEAMVIDVGMLEHGDGVMLKVANGGEVSITGLPREAVTELGRSLYQRVTLSIERDAEPLPEKPI